MDIFDKMGIALKNSFTILILLITINAVFNTISDIQNSTGVFTR